MKCLFFVDSILNGAPVVSNPPESGAGVNAEFSDDDFRDAGAEILSDASAVMNKVGVQKCGKNQETM